MSNKLVFGCIHLPYAHKNALNFLERVHKDYKCDKTVICTGDFLDFHSMSRHNTETDSMGVEQEYSVTLKFVDKFTRIFPHGVLILGNHDKIPQRQMSELGLAHSMLKNNNELYGLPKTWRVEPYYHVIKGFNVLAEHGIGSGGKFGAINTALAKRTSYVQSHIHSAAGVMYSTNYESTIFGMNVGCLCDESSLAMRYGRYNKNKGVLGCGIVHSGDKATFVKM